MSADFEAAARHNPSLLRKERIFTAKTNQQTTNRPMRGRISVARMHYTRADSSGFAYL